MKTDDQIKTALYHAIKYSPLGDLISGTVTKRDRPAESDKEDVCISILSNRGGGQIQRVIVNINIYVRDIYNPLSRQWEADDRRLSELCTLSQFLFDLYDQWFHVVGRESYQQCMEAGVIFPDSHTEHIINNQLLIEIINETY